METHFWHVANKSDTLVFFQWDGQGGWHTLLLGYEPRKIDIHHSNDVIDV
jgi:hypothetical protein